jgi:hypothetical protein
MYHNGWGCNQFGSAGLGIYPPLKRLLRANPTAKPIQPKLGAPLVTSSFLFYCLDNQIINCFTLKLFCPLFLIFLQATPIIPVFYFNQCVQKIQDEFLKFRVKIQVS